MQKGNPNLNLSYINHWDSNVSRHTWQTSEADLQEARCIRLSAVLGRNSHTEGRGSLAHRLGLVTRSWSRKGRRKSKDSLVLGTPMCVTGYIESGTCAPHGS